MGKSSGSGGGTSTSNVTQTNLPTYARPYYERLMQRGEMESNQPYQPYGAQRLADFSGDTSTAFQGVRDIFNAGDPSQFAPATSRTQQALDYNNPYTSTNFDGGEWGSGPAAQYMSPYIENVLDVTKGRMTRDFNEQQRDRDTAAVKAGAFGGSRAEIADQVAQRGLNEQMQYVDAQGLEGAYNNAAGLWDKDRMARIGALNLTDQSRQALANLGINVEQLGLSGAQTMAGLGQLQQQLGINRNMLLQQTGATEQAQEQQGLDIGYQDFINQRDYEQQQLQFLNSLLRGVPISANSNVTSYQPQPSSLQSLLGLGLGGAGLYKMLA